MRRPVALALAVALLATACGGEPENRAAEPATAPELSSVPVGVVVPVGSTPEGIVVGTGGNALVGTREPDGLTLLAVAEDGTGAEVLEVLATTSGGRHLDLAGPDGPALVPLEGSAQVLQVGLDDAAVLSSTDEVGSGPHNAVRTSDGTVVVTNEQGGGVLFLRDGVIVETVPAGPPQPGGLAAVGRYAVVADVQGDGVYVYDATTREQVAHRVIGDELTHALALAPAGTTDGTVVAFADTTGGAVLLTAITPDIEDLARIDVPGGRPYGLAFDPDRELLYVTLTASNALQVFDVTDPAAPVLRGELATVRQPNSVAVDPRSGTVLITGTVDGVLQLISTDLLPT